MLGENVTGHGVNQPTTCSCSNFAAMVFFNTCPNSLRVAGRSAAVCRGSFDRHVISLSTPKATQSTASMARVAGEGANVPS